MRLIFMGTPDFAIPTLKRLIVEYQVEGIFTQPDRPKGRGKKINISEVKKIALENNIKLFQPIKLKTDTLMIEEIRSIKPDFIIVVAFGQILPKEVLEIPTYGCINLHASLLPKYRGAAPINWALINGEVKTGNTTMLMDVGLDTGDILLQSEVEITDTMNAGELHDLLMNDGPELMSKTLKRYADGNLEPVKQINEVSTYSPTLNNVNCKIDWNKTAKSIYDLIRGLSPYPTAYTTYEDKIMKVFSASIIWKNTNLKPGQIVSVNKDGIQIATNDFIINITKLQFPGGKPLSVTEYIKGHTITVGQILF